MKNKNTAIKKEKNAKIKYYFLYKVKNSFIK